MLPPKPLLSVTSGSPERQSGCTTATGITVNKKKKKLQRPSLAFMRFRAASMFHIYFFLTCYKEEIKEMKREFTQCYKPVNFSEVQQSRNYVRALMLSLFLKQWPVLLCILQTNNRREVIYTQLYSELGSDCIFYEF